MPLETILATLVGGVVTWLVAWYHYKKTGDELLAESKELKLASDLILYKLQYPDTPTQLKRNDSGEVVGLIVEMSAHAAGSSTVAAYTTSRTE